MQYYNYDYITPSVSKKPFNVPDLLKSSHVYQNTNQLTPVIERQKK